MRFTTSPTVAAAPTTEGAAIQIDAAQRVTDLKAVVSRLWADRDDPMVLSELHSLLRELRRAEIEAKR